MVRGPLVAAFALAALFISVFYVAPPISLKRRGLGEPGRVPDLGSAHDRRDVLRGHRHDPGWVWIASLPYAILVTTVLFGKHIDKIEPDAERGIRTLPVILGERNARLVASGLMIAFYPIVIGSAWRADRSVGPPRGSRHPAPGAGPAPVLEAEPESPPHYVSGRCGSWAAPSFTHVARGRP